MIVSRQVYRCKIPTSQVVPYLKKLFPGARLLRPQTGHDFPHIKVVMEVEAEDLADLQRKQSEAWGMIEPDAAFWDEWRSKLEAEEAQLLTVV